MSHVYLLLHLREGRETERGGARKREEGGREREREREGREGKRKRERGEGGGGGEKGGRGERINSVAHWEEIFIFTYSLPSPPLLLSHLLPGHL